jgi:hypothetical protein
MTKKDFQLIASALRESFPERGSEHPTQQWERTVHTIASALSESNPRFDRARFLSACGLKENQ